LVDATDLQFDTAIFYLMMQACAANFSPTSFETRTLVSASQEISRRRIKAVFMRRDANILDIVGHQGIEAIGPDEVPQQDLYKVMALRKFASVRSRASSYSSMHEIGFKARWTEILHTDYELIDFYIKDGWAYFSPNDLIDILAQKIGAEMVNYMVEVKAKMERAKAQPHPFFIRIGKIVSEVAAKSHQDLIAMGGELKQQLFPPCIRLAEEGVGAGSRNYAITVLLTSFISHARISPLAGDAKISDFIDDMSIVTDEILPRVYEAGSRCNPPLFDDQPIEKANILYHLGFGLMTSPRLADSGNSTWYIPPNCEKIQREVPLLCNPDGLCNRIKNPIMYYLIKTRDAERESDEVSGVERPDRRS
jgi:DNA primase large subunit